MDRPSVAAIVDRLARHVDVLAYDSRGHGWSTGCSTVGDLEVLDVDAVVGTARALGYERVVTCGWSMGAASVVRHAALVGQHVAGHRVRHPVDAVISVSATSRWYVRDTAPMRRLHWLVERPCGRVISQWVMGTRVCRDGWHPVPLSPTEAAARLGGVPLLVVHGDRDAYFPLEHPRALHAAAGGASRLWIVEGFGHAEGGATPELVDRIGAEVPRLLRSVAS